jgi:hypothetical protein
MELELMVIVIASPIDYEPLAANLWSKKRVSLSTHVEKSRISASSSCCTRIDSLPRASHSRAIPPFSAPAPDQVLELAWYNRSDGLSGPGDVADLIIRALGLVCWQTRISGIPRTLRVSGS